MISPECELNQRFTSMIPWQKARTEVSEARSRYRTTTSEPSAPVCSRMSRAASSARVRSRQAMITRPRSRTIPAAVAFPMPLFAPVTMTVFPLIISAGSPLLRSRYPELIGADVS